MAETGSTMEIESQNEGAFNHNEADAPSLDNTSNPLHEKEIQDTAEHPSVNESGDFLAPLQNSSETPRTDIGGVSDSDQGATDSDAGITDSEPIVTDSEAGATDSEVGVTDSETSGTDLARHPGDKLLAPSIEHKPEESTGDSDAQANPTDLPSKETPAEGEDNSKKDTVNNEDSAHPSDPDKENPKHRRPVIDASKLKDKSDRQKKYRHKQLELQKKTIDQQKQTKEQKRQAVEERRKKQEEEKKVYRESIVRRSIERSQSAGSREKRRSWDPAKQIPATEPPRGRSMERLNDTPNEMVPAGIGVNKRLSSSVSTLWNPVQLVRLGPNQDDWFEVHTPRPKALRSPSPGIDDSNSSTYTPRHHSSSPNLALNTSWVRSTLEALIELPPHVQVFESAEYLENEFCEEDETGSNPQKHRYAASTASSRSRIYATRRRYRATTSQNKSSPNTPIRRTPTPGSRGRSTERKTPAPVQPAPTNETPSKTQRPASPKGFRAPSPKPSTGTPSSSSNSSMHVRQPSLRLKNKTTVDAKSPSDKTNKTPVSKSSQPPPIKKALTPAKSSPTRTPRTPSTNNKTPAASKTPTTTTRTSAGSRTPTSTKTPTSKPPAASKTPTAKPAAAKSPTVPKAAPVSKATPVNKSTPKETPKAASPTKEEAPKPDVPQVTEPEKKGSDSESSSPPPELSAEERAKQALAEKRRQMREKAEREAELERLRKEQEEKEEEERLRREEEERIKEEEEEQRLAEEYRKAEEERLQKAIEGQQRKEEEERLQAEDDEKKREEEERVKAEEKKKREEELTEKFKKDEEARDARKKRVDEIMKRARRATPVAKNDDEHDNRDEDKDIDTKAEKENGIEGSIYDNDNDKYRNCFGNGSTVGSHETLSGEMEQDMEAMQEGVMGEDDTVYGVRENPVVPEGGYLEGFPKENESEGENENAKSGEQVYEKAVTEEVGEKDDVMLASKIKDDSCEFEDHEEALIGETKQPVKFAEIVAMPTYPVESEVPASEKEEVGVETKLASDEKEAIGDLLGEFESDSADGNVFSTPKLESNVEFDLLGTDVDKGLAGENDGSSVDVFVEDLNQYDSLKHPKLAFCHQESDVTEDDDSTAAQAGDIDTSTGEADPSVGDIDISTSDVDLSAGDVDIRHPCDLETSGFDTKSNFEDFTSDDRVEIHRESQGLQDIHEEGSEEEAENSEIKNEAGEVENVEGDLLESCSSDRFIVIDEKSLQEGDSGDELVEEEEKELPADDDHVIPVVETSSHDKLVDDAEVRTSENEEVVEVSKDVGTIPEITLDEVEYVHQNSSGDEDDEDSVKEEGQYTGGDSEDEGIVEENSETIAHEENVETDEEKVSEEEDVGDHDAKSDSTFDITGHSHFDDSHKDEPEGIDVEENDEVVEGSERNDYVKEDELVESPCSSLENPIEEHDTTERVEGDCEEGGVGNIEAPSSMHRDDVDSHSSSDDSDVESPVVKKAAFFEGDRGNVDYLARDRVVSQSSEDKEREDSSSSSSSSSSDSENESNKKNRKMKVQENVFHVDAGNLGYLGDEERAQSSSPDIASRSPRVDDAEKLEFHSSASESEDAKDTIDSFPEVSSLNATRGSPIGDITMLGVQTPEGIFEEPGRIESEDDKDDAIDGDTVPEETPELDASEEIESGEPSSSLDASGEILLDTDSSDVKPQFEDEQTPDDEEQLSDDESSSDSVPATMKVDDECVEKENVSSSNVEVGEEGTSSQEILLSNQHPSGEDHNGNYSSEEEDDVDSVKAAEEHDDREENGMDMGGRQLTSSPSTNSTSSSEGSYTANPVDYHKHDDLIHTIDSPNTLHDQQHSVKHIGVHQDVYPGKESSIVLDAVREDDDGLNGKSAQTDEEDVSVSTEL